MLQPLVLVIVFLPLICLAQIKLKKNQNDINYKDIVELNSLIYFKADTTLVSGKVVRYNKKNKAKKYFLVSEGKPDHLGWVIINDDLQTPKESGLGDVLLAGVFVTGLVMDISGNAPNLPINQAINQSNVNKPINPIGGYPRAQKRYTSKAYNDMLDKNEISKSYSLVKDGENEFFHELNKDGQIKNKENFIEENKNGIREAFYDNGQLRSKGTYNQGIKDGLWHEYHNNGNLESNVKYIEGIKEGLLESYYYKGQLHAKINYKDGKENGVMLVYHENGQLMIKGVFKEAKEIGEWKFYNENGELINTEIFDD